VSIHPRRVAAALRIMRVEVGHPFVAEKTLDQRRHVAAVGEVGVEHLARVIERPERDRTDRQDLGYHIDRLECPLRALADEDRMARAIGGVGGLVGEVEQQHGLARLGIAKLDPVGKAGLPINPVALDAPRSERGIGQAIEMAERCRIEAGNAKGHGELHRVIGAQMPVRAARRAPEPVFKSGKLPPFSLATRRKG
jgi:hypothetical protein